MKQQTKQIPDGYKQTEAGVIPEDWDISILRNSIDVHRGGSPRPIQDYIVASGGVNWIKIGDVGVGAKYIDYTDEKIKSEGVRYSREVKPGDFLLSNSMSFGRPYITRIEGCIHDGWLVLQNYQDSYVDEFLYYLLSSKVVIDQYLERASGSSVLNLNKDLVSTVKLPTPTKTEQTVIASVLSETDTLIEKLEKLIEKKKAIKQGAMQQLLTGKKRLPGFNGDWKEKSIADFGKIVTGSTPSTYNKNYWGEKYPWVTPTDISTRRDIYNSERSITQTGMDVSRRLPGDTVLVTCIASIGKNAILKNEGACNQQINAIIPNDDFSAEFIYYLVENSKEYLLSKAGITATNIISKKEFSLIKFKVPNIEEQASIAEVLSDMDAEIELIEEKLEKYKQIKTGMMQQLLTGKIRLVN